MLTLVMLEQLWPHGNSIVPGLREGIAASAPAVFSKWDVRNDAEIAIVMAQLSEECGCGTELQENMNYSAARLLQVFPRHFTPAQAIAMQHQPRLIADQAYGSRMGDRPGTDDGWDKRGQGLSQLTGEDNYAALSKLTGYDLINHPEILLAPATALDCAVADLVQCGCMPFLHAGNFAMVTEKLNGGQNGEGLRVQQWALWKHVLGGVKPPPASFCVSAVAASFIIRSFVSGEKEPAMEYGGHHTAG